MPLSRAGGSVGDRGVAAKGGHNPRAGGDPTNRVIESVGHVEIPGGIDGDAERFVEARGGAGAIGEALGAGDAGDGADIAPREEADRGVEGIGNVDVARTVHRHAGGIVERRAQVRVPVGVSGDRGRAGDGRHCPRRSDLANGLRRPELGDVKIARAVQRQAHRIGKARSRAGAVHGAVLFPARPARVLDVSVPAPLEILRMVLPLPVSAT